MRIEEYNPVLDGLRAIAILSVFIFHLNPLWFPGGFYGVDIFFVISGYLITSIILKDITKKRFSFSNFYHRRMARLVPVYLLVSASTLIASHWIYGQRDFASIGAMAAASSVFATNLKLLNQGSYFEVPADTQPLLHYWSLSVEEQFYLFFPAFLIVAKRLFSNERALARVIGTCLAVSFFSCIALHHLRPVWSFYLLPTRAWELMAGSLLALSATRNFLRLPARLSQMVHVTGLLVTLLCIFQLPGQWEAQYNPWVASLVVVGTVISLAFSREQSSVNRVLAHPIFTYVGLLSYSLYMWHWPIFSMVDFAFFARSETFRLSIKVFLTIASATASYHLFERPLRNFLNHRGFQKQVIIGLSCGLAMTMLAGSLIRTTYYLNDPPLKNVASGGVILNGHVKKCSVVLVGDSIASMYTCGLRDFANEHGIRAQILSVHSQSPVPGSELWAASIETIRRERPEVIIFSAAWHAHFTDRQKLSSAIAELRSHTPNLIVITEPPVLPAAASRASIRANGIEPYFEQSRTKTSRLLAKSWLETLGSAEVRLIDIDGLCTHPDGSLKFIGSDGRPFYRDFTHLDVEGANDVLRQLIVPILMQLTATHDD